MHVLAKIQSTLVLARRHLTILTGTVALFVLADATQRRELEGHSDSGGQLTLFDEKTSQHRLKSCVV